MLRSLLNRIQFRNHAGLQMLLLFAAEGALLQFTGSINGFANNLYATNLGATDAQIGLVQMVPNLVAVALMLPLGMLADRARSPRALPLAALWTMAAGYVLMGLVPSFGASRMTVFYLALAFTVGGPALYNAQWQSFFGDVTAIEQRNDILTLRNRAMFIIGVGAPILCGMLMGTQEAAEGKLWVLQVFFFVCAAITVAQALTILRIPTQKRAPAQKANPLKEIAGTIAGLARNRAFLWFYIPVLLFYMIWQLDWSMWYIGQVQYLLFTETQLSIVSGVFNIGQLAAIGILAGFVRRKGTDYVLCAAPLGLAFCPVIMIVCSLLPVGARFLSFTVLLTVLNALQCAVNLCVVQILLRVAPQKNRALVVSLYTLSTTLTNSFMPSVGVALYTALGADHRALILFNLIVLVLRIAAFIMIVARYRVLKKTGGLEELAPNID